MPFVKVKPNTWPQDALEVPNGFGRMPPTEFGNENVVGQEFFALSARFVFNPLTPAYTTQTAILVTPQDGDFWCDAIGVVSWEQNPGGAGVTKDLQRFLCSMLSIQDARTSKPLIYNPGFTPTNNPAGPVFPPNCVPINFFRKLPQSGEESSGNYPGDTPTPSGFRVTQTLMQPFCFTRQGAINLSLTTLVAVPAAFTFDVTVAFTGWKEYAHASR